MSWFYISAFFHSETATPTLPRCDMRHNILFEKIERYNKIPIASASSLAFRGGQMHSPMLQHKLRSVTCLSFNGALKVGRLAALQQTITTVKFEGEAVPRNDGAAGVTDTDLLPREKKGSTQASPSSMGPRPKHRIDSAYAKKMLPISSTFRSIAHWNTIKSTDSESSLHHKLLLSLAFAKKPGMWLEFYGSVSFALRSIERNVIVCKMRDMLSARKVKHEFSSSTKILPFSGKTSEYTTFYSIYQYFSTHFSSAYSIYNKKSSSYEGYEYGSNS